MDSILRTREFEGIINAEDACLDTILARLTRLEKQNRRSMFAGTVGFSDS